MLQQENTPNVKTRRCLTCKQDVESSTWRQHILAHGRYARRAHVLTLAGTTRGTRKRRLAKLPNYEYLRRGRALGWKLAPLALSKNSYPILRRYVDDADESMSDEMKDFAIGLMMSTGAKLNRSYGIVSVPLRWSTLPKATARPVLLLNQDESNAIDLDLGTGAGATTAADVSPPILPVAQKKGLDVKKKVKSTVVKRAAPTVTSTPVTPTSIKQSTITISEKTEEPKRREFKIPFKRHRPQTESDSSDGRESAVSSMPEVQTTSKSWDCASRKHGGVFSGYRDQPKFRRRGVPSQKRRIEKVQERTEVHNSDLVAERCPSVESLDAPRDFESMARMMLEMRRQLMEQREQPQGHLSQRTHGSEKRRERYEERPNSRWRSPDWYGHPGRIGRADRGRGFRDNRWR